jgi:hypothetical protein
VDEQVRKSRDLEYEVWARGKETGCLIFALGVNMGAKKRQNQEQKKRNKNRAERPVQVKRQARELQGDSATRRVV